jgi:hypothetical protein
MNPAQLIVLLVLIQLPTRGSEPVVTLSPPHASIGPDSGGSFIRLLHETGTVTLPWPAPKALLSGGAWYVIIENLGPEDVTVQGGKGFSVPLRPKDKVRIQSDTQRYFIKR